MRVLHNEAGRHGGLHAEARAASIQDRELRSDEQAKRAVWSSWFNGLFCKTLAAAGREARAQGVSRRTIERAIVEQEPRPLTAVLSHKLKTHFQRTAAKQLTEDRASRARKIEAPLRKKLNRWSISVPQGRRAIRYIQHMGAMKGKVPPRVTSAMIRTACNGWCTARRFQVQPSRCMMGCRQGEDSIEHYAVCPIVAEVAHERLRLKQPDSNQHKLENMLGFNLGDNMDICVRRHCLTAATYRLHNIKRHGTFNLDKQGMKDALAQALKDVVAGHGPAQHCTATAWAQPPAAARRTPRRQRQQAEQ